MGTHNLVQCLTFFTLIAIMLTGSDCDSIEETTKKEIRKNIELLTILNFEDMPQKEDMTLFMTSIIQIVDFCTKYKEDISVNLAIGLFLINVNLKKVLRNISKNRINSFMDGVQKTVEKNERLLQYIDVQVQAGLLSDDDSDRKILSLFTNTTQWVERLPDFNVVIGPRQDRSNALDADKMNLKTNSYRRNSYCRTIYDSIRTETADKSDYCITSLAINTDREHNLIQAPRCEFDYTCYTLLISDLDTGYTITHRLLWVLLAHFGRGCVLFSAATDQKITEQFCTIIFSEAQLNALLRFPSLDLLLEQIALCTLAGHAEFLQREWLLAALNFQTVMGGFAKQKLKLDDPALEEMMASISPDEKIGFGDLSEGHMTAVAGAAISSAIRFLATVYEY